MHSNARGELEGKGREGKELIECFEEIWKAYPERDGNKSKIQKNIIKQLSNGSSPDELRLSFQNYMNYVKMKREDNFPELRYKNRATFFNNWKDWVDWEPTVSEQDTRKLL
jgi:hypothetical protein